MKLFAILTAAMIFTIIFASSATNVYYEACGYTKADASIDVNISYLTPTPVNYTLVPLTLPHEIYIGSQRFFTATEM